MAQARTESYRLSSYCGRFVREHGRWPDVDELLAQRQDLPSRDPWGRHYAVRLTGDGGAAWVQSAGQDGAHGTADDVAGPRYVVRDGFERDGLRSHDGREPPPVLRQRGELGLRR